MTADALKAVCLCSPPGCLILDALQVAAARRRWQWANLGPGANDCPVCKQLPPDEETQP